MRSVSPRRRRRDAKYAEARLAVFERSGGRCEAMFIELCTGRCEQVHHIAGRGGSDPHRVTNLVGVCQPCHQAIENQPIRAAEAGLRRSKHTRRTV